MRVLCSTIDGEDVKGEVIGGERFDEESGSDDLTERFTLRCDDGTFLEVRGWLVDVTVLGTPPVYVM